MIETNDTRLFLRDDGPVDGPAILFIHALGLDHRIWDPVVAQLPGEMRVIRYDLRGHGQSAVPAGPYSMGMLVRDAEAVLDHLGLRNVVVVGLSIGGMIAQGLAVKRLDLVRALVLSNTAAKFGQAPHWHARAKTVRQDGMASVIAPTMERWFGRKWRANGHDAPIAARLAACDPEGYASCCEAIAGTDFYTPTSGLRLPTLGIAGAEDGSTPPDLVRETVDLIPGSKFKLLRRAGHLPFVEEPAAYGAALSEFLKEIGECPDG